MGKNKDNATGAALAQVRSMEDVVRDISHEHDVLKALRPTPGTAGETGAKLIAAMWDEVASMGKSIKRLIQINALTDGMQAVEIAATRNRVRQDEAVIFAGAPVLPGALPFGRTVLDEQPATPAPPPGFEVYEVSAAKGWTVTPRAGAGTGGTAAFTVPLTPDEHDGGATVPSNLASFGIHILTGTGAAAGVLARVVPPAGLVIQPWDARRSPAFGIATTDPLYTTAYPAYGLYVVPSMDGDGTLLRLDIVVGGALVDNTDYYLRMGLYQPPSP